MAGFKIAAAQIPSIRGDIHRNIVAHLAAASAATSHGVALLVFPELSLTGYEPELACELAMSANDPRLAPLLALARQHRMALVIGAPLQSGAEKPHLGAIVFTAEGETKTYAKMHLGGSEPQFFQPGVEPLALTVDGMTTGIAICADASRPSHPQAYANAGAQIYAAGVFLTEEWHATDAPRLAEHAKRCDLLVVMANHAASTGTLQSIGKSAVWAPGGALLAQAEGTEDSLVIATVDGGAWRAGVLPLRA